MDSVSQIVLGAACGEAVAGKQLGNKALLWGAIGGTIPDLDTFLTPFFDDISGLLIHRGYTHSLFFSFALAPLLGWIVYRFNKNASYFTWVNLFFWSLITHPMLDAFTGYGTPLLLPFSDYRFDINSIFIIDPVYTLIYIFCLVKVMRAKKDIDKRTKWNWRGITLTTSYLLFTVVNQGYHTASFKEELASQKIKYVTTFSGPTAFNQFMFYNITVTDGGYYHGYHSLFDGGSKIDLKYYPKNDDLLPKKFHLHKDILKLKYFSKGYYCLHEEEGKLYFCDVRFGKIGGFYGEESPWVFRWEIKIKDNELALKKGNWSMSRFKAIGNLFSRIGGK